MKHLSWFAVLLLLAVRAPSASADAQAGTSAGTAAPRPTQGAPAPPPLGAPATPTLNASPNYVVGPNDRLRLTVWNQEDVSGEYVVSADGTFTFPLVGQVKAAGLTLSKLEAELKQLLTDKEKLNRNALELRQLLLEKEKLDAAKQFLEKNK